MRRISLGAAVVVGLASGGLLFAQACGSSGSGPTGDDGGVKDGAKPDTGKRDTGSHDSGHEAASHDTGGHDSPAPGDAGGDGGVLAAARAKIKHIIIINQENRSFDTYF